MIKTAASHLDHNLTPDQVAHIMERFAGRDAFFIETFDLPADLGTAPCGLYGPLMGDDPVADADATTATRGTRTWMSRMVDRPARATRSITVIAGPNNGEACVLYTAFGGPLAPQEPGDPGCKDPVGSAAFWVVHGLAR